MGAASQAVRPSEAAYAQAFKDVGRHVELDSQWSKVKTAIESHCGLLGKQPAVRVRNWVKKLSEETANVTWKKNRNAYARLLLEQLRCGKLCEPFGGQPPGGPLPTLPKHLVYAFMPARSTGSPSAAQAQAAGGQQWAPVQAGGQQWTQAPGPAAAAPGAIQRQQTAPPAHQLSQQQRQPQEHVHMQQRHLSATEQLDVYLGRADYRRAEHADEQERAAATMAAAAASARALDSDDGGPQYLPGTRMQLRGAEGRRVDRPQLGDVGWQPSKLELEAQLGASRERQAELEWRLGQMEGLLRQHAVLLQPQPLGSLLDAIDDGHVSPPKQRPGKKELEELIERYEAKRRQWQSPAWAAGGSGRPAATGGVRRGGSPIAHSDEAEILQQLGNFQRQTDTIRQQLAGGGGGGAADHAPPHPPGSSMAAHSSNGSDWEQLLAGTPVRQQPTGLRGGGYTPHHGVGGGGSSMALFDGLPPSPAAFEANRWAGGNRHVHHAGHHLSQPSQYQQQVEQQQVEQALQAAQPAASSMQAGSGSRLAAVAAAAQQQQRPRSPIGLDVRHTKKSAAAAEKAAAGAQPSPGAAAALQRLKSKRQVVGPALSPGGQQQQQQQQQQQDAGTQPQRRQYDEGVQVQQEAAEKGVQAPTPTAPLQLPPDSNAALMADVRELRTKLLSSMQKHDPELAAGSGGPGSGLGGVLATAQKWQAEQLRAEQAAGSTWRLPAEPSAFAAEAPLPSAPMPAPPSASHSSLKLSDPWSSEWLGPSAASAARAGAAGVSAAGAASSSKFRLTDDLGSVFGGSGRHRLTDMSPGSGGLTPSSLLGSGDGGLGRLGSLEPSGSVGSLGSLAIPNDSWDLNSFEQHTESLRQRLAGL